MKNILVFCAIVLIMRAPLFGQDQSKDMNPANLVGALEGTWQHTSPDGRMTVKFVPVQMQMGPSEDAEVRNALYGFILYEDASTTVLNYLNEIDKYESNQYINFQSFINTPKDKIPQFVVSYSSITDMIAGSFSLLDRKYAFSVSLNSLNDSTIIMKSIPDPRNEADLNIFPKEISELTFTRVE
ncbi:hypothetical protein A3SI_07379 [Nitritalea halalkaliphila LW7]|uniref:DUF6705 domain-containing protein n=1 Tax=Nitritalea halalkaliphila LW7 TaxID=1189621 RepID=I5C5K3_9BACT|nr:DUF6705 family protein [Nitritalea halalkaliphila]EIM77105.1 hypothetical protein A3SI_07379 [Nitritalea halalkaliphila LW7]